MISKPSLGMGTIAALTTMDEHHVERMQRVARPARRPAAILFADLEGSSPLARRLSTASYFALGRRLVRAADQCVVDAGGLVGRHVGDGVVAFFLTETYGSESAAARACITAARALGAARRRRGAQRPGSPTTSSCASGCTGAPRSTSATSPRRGRTEVTALGDEVNEAARIEACATGGRTLASKALIERLDPDDAAALGLDPDRITYIPLADLPTATERPDATLRRSRSATSPKRRDQSVQGRGTATRCRAIRPTIWALTRQTLILTTGPPLGAPFRP